MKRIIIGGTGSGCGKTTVTCGILSALKKRGISVSSFKCGPDYIDPMFHRRLLNTDAHNLDSFFCDNDVLCGILERYGSNTDISVIEGVMGYYDGSSGSAHSVATVTNTPAVLVINCKGMSDSIGAVMKGFISYQVPNNISGFIFNMLPEKLIPLAEKLCNELDTEYYGCLPKSCLTIESRHLGLVTADEIEDIDRKLGELGIITEKYILIDKLLSLPQRPVPQHNEYQMPLFESPPVIAVARDNAFCFQYAENIDILTDMGCELRFFSPLSDKHVPDADGLILCGGYPELYAEKLSANLTMRLEIKALLSDDMPYIAECGGFMYLHDELETSDQKSYPMVGIINGRTFPCDRLKRFGYVSMTAETDSILCSKGSKIKAHEFHYWDSTNCGRDFIALKTNGANWSCGHTSAVHYAGFPHIYFPAHITIPQRFVKACINYRNRKGR